MIYLEPKHLKIVKDILAKYPYEFYAFGSRVKGTHRKFSDLDLCFMENIPWNVRAHIEEDLDESDLPFKIDVIDFNVADEGFKKAIEKDLVLISKDE